MAPETGTRYWCWVSGRDDRRRQHVLGDGEVGQDCCQGHEGDRWTVDAMRDVASFRSRRTIQPWTPTQHAGIHIRDDPTQYPELILHSPPQRRRNLFVHADPRPPISTRIFFGPAPFPRTPHRTPSLQRFEPYNSPRPAHPLRVGRSYPIFNPSTRLPKPANMFDWHSPSLETNALSPQLHEILGRL
jgi:hypothetical protein